MSSDGWGGRRAAAARASLLMRTTWPVACGHCGKPVYTTDRWVVGHIKSRTLYPELMWDPANHRVEHRSCSDRSGQAAVIEKARVDGARDVLAQLGLDPDLALSAATDSFPHDDDVRQPPPLPAHTHEVPSAPVEARPGLTWAELCENAPPWLTPYLDVPEDAAPPLWVSSVHPDAVGSMGSAAIEWMESNIIERGRPLRLRWWQRLAIVLQLQHRADGTLCWRVVLESGPRRIGKSVRLRGMALWRLRHGATFFEPEQLVLHTGKDLAIVREVMRKAWAWAGPLDDWDIKRGMTEPEVSYLTDNRWVARSKDSTTGYDACLALCDEAWDVPPASIDDDLEPTMLERESPQLVLTSTAHRRATSLMRGRILDALTTFDGETLVLIWAMPPGADPGDPATWRAASPHWSEDRLRMITSKYAKALAGEADPEADDPDPMQGFIAQYGNVWRLRERRTDKGDPVISADAWADLATPVVATTPTAAAIESWFDQGVTLVLAWRTPAGVVLVSASDHPDVHAATAALKASGFRGKTTVGASLVEHPALRRRSMRSGEGQVLTAVQELARLLAEGVVRHDAGPHLTDQVLGLRTTPSVNGPRMASTGRADAVKAAVWAIRAARVPASQIKGIVLSSSGKPVTQNRQQAS